MSIDVVSELIGQTIRRNVFDRVCCRSDEHRKVKRDYAPEIKRLGRKQIGMFLTVRARTFVTLSRPSIINQHIYWPQDGEYTVTRVPSSPTRAKLMRDPRHITSTSSRSPLHGPSVPLRQLKSQIEQGREVPMNFRCHM